MHVVKLKAKFETTKYLLQGTTYRFMYMHAYTIVYTTTYS